MNHYDILEVSPRASAEVIRAAYRSLMQRYHPDRNADAAEATARTAEIALAYDVLSDPERRRAYDESLQRAPADAPALAPAHAAVMAARGAQWQAAPGGGWRSWYGGLLILCIIAAGWAIFTLQKKPARAPAAPLPAPTVIPAAAAPVPASPVDGGTSEAWTARPGEGQARTLAAFVTDLSIELAPASPSAAAHVLQIPNIGLRIGAGPGDNGRLAERVEAQRALIIQQLLGSLARADYHELIKTDGDLYLKRLIEDTVCSGLCPTPTTALSAPAASSQPRPVEALLPLSYTLR